MKKLNRELLNENLQLNSWMGTKNMLPERVLQFGEGNFLRAFVDYMIDELNSNNLFNGSITVVQPIAQGMVDMLKQQDGLYTLLLRGLENGSEVCIKKIVTSIQAYVNPYTEYEKYMDSVKNPELRFIVSNTTEAGISYHASDTLDMKPQISFPGKVTSLLYQRFLHFKGDKTKGFIFIPCELIDYNGTTLKEIVLRYANEWNLGSDFIAWVMDSNYFTNTLVDRIVTGYPKDEIAELTKELGYTDNLIDTGEIFHFWVIEGPTEIKNELPFDKIGLNVLFTEDATPYKMRKVRILNGAHTSSVLGAYLAGKNTVGEMMDDPIFHNYLHKALFDEVIPTLDLPYEDLKMFADAVFDRFANPYIKHYLLSISLNSVSKFKARVLPSILEYYKRNNCIPKILTFSFAALIAFYKGSEIKDGALIGKRGNEEYKIMDDLSILETFKTLWADNGTNSEGLSKISQEVCKNVEFWGTDLTTLPNFCEYVTKYLQNIMQKGSMNAIIEITSGDAK